MSDPVDRADPADAAPAVEHNLAGLFQRYVGTGRTAYIDLTAGGVDGPPATVGYDELEDRCGRVAGGLAARGLGHGARVAVAADNSVDYAALYLGVPRQGLVLVPLNTRQPRDVLAFTCEDADVQLVCCDPAYADKVPAGVPTIEIGSPAWRDLLAHGPLPVGPVAPLDVAVQMYTSGSTGRPKGVLLSHLSQTFTVAQYAGGGYMMDPDERVLVSAPMYHKNAAVQTKVCLALGGQIVLLARFDAVSYLRAIDRHGVTSVTGVPTMFALMTAQVDLLRSIDLSSVRRMMIGSAPMTEGLFDQVRAAFPDAIITNGYGTTESIACFGTHPEGKPRPKIALGYPLPTVETRLVNPATGEDANPGEFWVRSPGVMNGYHNLPEVTGARLTDGWYHTGDVMERDEDGWHFFVGRVDDMFVCAGENVYPGDVEQMLERNPAVHQAAVVPVDDELKGQLPVAFVVVEPGHTLTEEDVKAWALEHGPAYQHPRAVWFVEEILLGGTAKIDKTALKAEAAGRFSR